MRPVDTDTGRHLTSTVAAAVAGAYGRLLAELDVLPADAEGSLAALVGLGRFLAGAGEPARVAHRIASPTGLAVLVAPYRGPGPDD